MTVIFTQKQPIFPELTSCSAHSSSTSPSKWFPYLGCDCTSTDQVPFQSPSSPRTNSSNSYYTFPSFHIPNKANSAKYDASLYLIALLNKHKHTLDCAEVLVVYKTKKKKNQQSVGESGLDVRSFSCVRMCFFSSLVTTRETRAPNVSESPSVRPVWFTSLQCVIFKLLGGRTIKHGGLKQKCCKKTTERKRGGVCKLKLYYCCTPFLHRGEEGGGGGGVRPAWRWKRRRGEVVVGLVILYLPHL